MSKHMSKLTAKNLLDELGSKGLIDGQELSDFVIKQHPEKEFPLYLRMFAGIGAFLASLCLVAFLWSIGFFDYRRVVDLIILGMLFAAGAIGLQWIADRQMATDHDETVGHSFLLQSSFSSMAIGKIMLAIGIEKIWGFGWGMLAGVLILTAITYPIYRVSLDRFLSSFAVLFLILVNILWNSSDRISTELLLNIFFLCQFSGVAILFTHGKIKRDYTPLAFAFSFSLCVHILYLTSVAELGDLRFHEKLIHQGFVNMLLAGGLLALCLWLAGGVKQINKEPLILTSVGAVLLGIISAPGILLAIGLMILGYAGHQKILILLGILLMPVFIVLYYYGLDLTLMAKSGVLIGSGLALLAGRLYLKHRGWDKGGASCVQS